MLEGKITTRGRIEYQFKTFGGVTVLFIEVKLDIGSLSERLDCYAQVIAESDGMLIQLTLRHKLITLEYALGSIYRMDSMFRFWQFYATARVSRSSNS